MLSWNAARGKRPVRDSALRLRARVNPRPIATIIVAVPNFTKVCTSMSPKKKLLLGILILAIACLLFAAPSLIHQGALAWQRRSVHRIFARYSPSERRSLNTTPMPVILPQPNPNALPLITEENNSYLIRFPPPQAEDHWGHRRALVLSYPQFTVRFLIPHSTTGDDAAVQALYHTDFWGYQVRANHVRLDDIDTQPDGKSLINILSLLSYKATSWPLYTYFAEFAQDDRCGMIRAADEKKLRLHALIVFPRTHTICGMYFENKAGVDPAEVHKFLATLQIEPLPTATAPAK